MQIKTIRNDIFVVADPGKSIRRKGETGPNDALAVLIEPGDSPDNWEDCEFASSTDAYSGRTTASNLVEFFDGINFSENNEYNAEL